MLIKRFYTDGDPATPATDDPAIADGSKTPEPNNTDPDKGNPDDPGAGKSTIDDGIDYKAKYEESEAERVKAQDNFKELQRGMTPKLEKLAEIEKTQRSKVDENDVLVQIDKQIAKNKEEIVKYNAQNIDTTALETNIFTLNHQKNTVIADRQRDADNVHLGHFQLEHPEFTDFTGLTKIITEASKKGEPMGWFGAYETWSKDQEIAKLKDSAVIDKENKNLGKAATGQDGKQPPVSDTTEGRKADREFYTPIYGEEKTAKMLKQKK